MTTTEFFRFALWANGLPYEGANLTIEQVQSHAGVSRPTAYRLLAYYFDAKGWCWPREKPKAGRGKAQGGEHPWARSQRQEVANAMAA